MFEANREKIEAQNAERRSAAEKDAKKVDGLKIQLIRQASNTGQLYGSVTARDLAEALEGQGHKVAKNQIVLDRPIKGIGVQDVKIALHPEVSVTVQVNIARSPEEAELQAQGIDVMAQMFERDAAPPAEELQPVVETDEAGEAAADEPAAETAEAEAAEADTAEDGDTPAAEEGEKSE